MQLLLLLLHIWVFTESKKRPQRCKKCDLTPVFNGRFGIHPEWTSAQPLRAGTGLDGLSDRLPIWIKLQDETFFGFLLSVKFKVQMRCEAELSFIRTAAQHQGERQNSFKTDFQGVNRRFNATKASASQQTFLTFAAGSSPRSQEVKQRSRTCSGIVRFPQTRSESEPAVNVGEKAKSPINRAKFRTRSKFPAQPPNTPPVGPGSARRATRLQLFLKIHLLREVCSRVRACERAHVFNKLRETRKDEALFRLRVKV